MEKNKPIKKFRVGSISASVWKNTNKNKEGQTFDVHSVTLQRVYTDKTGKPANTNTLRKEDIPKAIMVLLGAEKYFTALDSETMEVV